jgi:hypothetical protein
MGAVEDARQRIAPEAVGTEGARRRRPQFLHDVLVVGIVRRRVLIAGTITTTNSPIHDVLLVLNALYVCAAKYASGVGAGDVVRVVI